MFTLTEHVVSQIFNLRGNVEFNDQLIISNNQVIAEAKKLMIV